MKCPRIFEASNFYIYSYIHIFGIFLKNNAWYGKRINFFFIFFSRKMMANEDIGGDETRWRTCITWGLFDGRVAYIESVGGNKTVVGWNVVFQSFRHCETVDLREVCCYYRESIRIFLCMYKYSCTYFVRHVDHVTIDGRFLASVYSCKYMILFRRTKRFFSFMRLQWKLISYATINDRKLINTALFRSKRKKKKKDIKM